MLAVDKLGLHRIVCSGAFYPKHHPRILEAQFLIQHNHQHKDGQITIPMNIFNYLLVK